MTAQQRTQFGGWPWKDDAPVHDRGLQRFAKFADGHEEFPQPAGGNASEPKTAEADA